MDFEKLGEKKVLGFSMPTFVIGCVVAVLIAAAALLTFMLAEQKQMNAELQELAELDKLEMEDQYRVLAEQMQQLR
jgi:hypothetical protein